MNTSHLLSLQDVANQLGVEYKTVYRLVRKGDLPATRVGWLYRLRQEDVDAYLASQSTQALIQSPPITTTNNYLRCTQCHRLIKDEMNIGGLCQHADCEAVICATCWANEIHICLEHAPTPAMKLAIARQAKAAGEIPLLVSAIEARRRELNFHHRFTRKLHALTNLPHPTDGVPINIQNLDSGHTTSDEKEQLTQFLGQGPTTATLSPSVETVAHFPVNLRNGYYITGDRKRPSLSIIGQTVSRLPIFARDTFDTIPLTGQELFTLLIKEAAAAEAANQTIVLGLAATTGWHEDARNLLLGVARGEAWAHPLLLPCLIDLETRALHYNPTNAVMPFFANLFALPLPEEEVMAVEQYVEATLRQQSSLADSEVCTALGVSTGAVLTAFQRLVAGGHYFIEDVDGIGRVIAAL